VTRERLYLDAMEAVLNNSSKVMIDVEGSGNLLYLPLDRMMGQAAAAPLLPQSSQAVDAARQEVENRARERMADDVRSRATLRSRETR
jgi:membrane protease subunit HflK